MNEIDLLLSKSRYEEALDCIDQLLSEKEPNSVNDVLLLKKAHALLQIDTFSMNSVNKNIEEVYKILNSIDEQDTANYVYKKLLLPKYYKYTKNVDERSKIFSQLNEINFREYPKYYSIYLREKGIEIEKYLMGLKGIDWKELKIDNSLISDYLMFLQESLKVSINQNQPNEYIETLCEYSQIICTAIQYGYVELELTSELNDLYIDCENKIIASFALVNISWVNLVDNQFLNCKNNLDRIASNLNGKVDELPLYLVSQYYMVRGHMENARGKFKIAIENFEKSITENASEMMKNHISGYIGMSYFLMSDPENTFKSLDLARKDVYLGDWVNSIYFLYAYEIGDLELMEKIYEHIGTHKRNFPFLGKIVILLAQALIFKKSERLRDKLRAHENLEEIVNMDYKFPGYYFIALLHLVDLLLLELKVSGDILLINEIELYFDKADKYVRETGNETMRLEFIILRSRLNFISLEFDQALEGLIRGRDIAVNLEMESYIDIFNNEINQIKLDYEKIKLLTTDSRDGLKEIANVTNLDNIIGEILKKRKTIDKKMIRNYIEVALESIKQ